MDYKETLEKIYRYMEGTYAILHIVFTLACLGIGVSMLVWQVMGFNSLTVTSFTAKHEVQFGSALVLSGILSRWRSTRWVLFFLLLVAIGTFVILIFSSGPLLQIEAILAFFAAALGAATIASIQNLEEGCDYVKQYLPSSE